jgi:hypothetical protein
MMKETAAELAKKTAQNAEKPTLDRRYGEIGISAVAAAVRYQGSAKNPAYAPVPTHYDSWTDEAA